MIQKMDKQSETNLALNAPVLQNPHSLVRASGPSLSYPGKPESSTNRSSKT
jgi:hypothetical protein